jgi:hypothetical protein
MDSKLLNERFLILLEWVNDQPALPKNFDRINLARYLKATDLDLEEAKKLFLNSLEWRKRYPNIFAKRDPFQQQFKNLIKIVFVQFLIFLSNKDLNVLF